MSASQRRRTRYERAASPGAALRGVAITANPLTLLSALILVSIGLGVLHNRLLRNGRTDPVIATAATIALPFQYSASRIEGSLIFGWDWLFPRRPLAQENARLVQEVTRLRLENENLRKKAEEADRLQAVLNFVQSQEKPPVAASIISWLPSAHLETITLNCGTRQGVKAQSAARTPEGLIGQVTDATPFTAQVMLLTDSESRVSGMIYRNGKAREYTGIIQGGGRDAPLTMLYLRRDADVKPGDTVRTSGYGGVFPPDIPIGAVIAVEEDKPRSLKLARIRPAAPMPGTLREAIVLP